MAAQKCLRREHPPAAPRRPAGAAACGASPMRCISKYLAAQAVGAARGGGRGGPRMRRLRRACRERGRPRRRPSALNNWTTLSPNPSRPHAAAGLPVVSSREPRKARVARWTYLPTPGAAATSQTTATPAAARAPRPRVVADGAVVRPASGRRVLGGDPSARAPCGPTTPHAGGAWTTVLTTTQVVAGAPPARLLLRRLAPQAVARLRRRRPTAASRPATTMSAGPQPEPGRPPRRRSRRGAACRRRCRRRRAAVA